MTDNTDDSTLHKLAEMTFTEPGTTIDIRLRVPAGHKLSDFVADNADVREIAEIGQLSLSEPGVIKSENRTAEGIASGQDDGRVAIKDPINRHTTAEADRVYKFQDVMAGIEAIARSADNEVMTASQRIDMLAARAQKLEIAFEAQAKRVENMEAWTEGSAKTARNLTTRLDTMLAQLDRQGERLEKIEDTVARIDDLPLRNMLSRIETREEGARSMHPRIKKLEDLLPAALGLTPKERPATPIEQAINAVSDLLIARANGLARRMDSQDERMAKLEGRIGNAIESVVGVADFEKFDREQMDRKFGEGKSKRMIKGGWYIIRKANSEAFAYSSTGPWETQEIAQARASGPTYPVLAIVQMPDFTEGEGL